MRGMPLFKGFDDYIEVFRAGEQTDSGGNTRTWTHGDLDQMVANHTVETAPIVVGHPKSDAPAYGWTEKLKRVGDVLFAKFEQVEPQFEKMVSDGRFKKRSVAVHKDKNGYYIRHIGWLGAARPAVEGLKPAQFAATDDDIESFEFESDWVTPSLLSRFFRLFREMTIADKGLDKANQIMPEYMIDEANNQADALRNPPEQDPAFTGHPYSHPSLQTNTEGDGDMPKSGDQEKTFTQADLDQAVADAEKRGSESAQSDFSSENTELKDKLAAEKSERLSGEHQAFIDKAIDAGQLTPALAEGAPEFMLALSLADEDNQEFEFTAGEGDKQETKKVSLHKWYSNFIAKLGKQINLGESHEFKDGDGNIVDLNDPLAIERAAKEYISAEAGKGHTVNIVTAVNHVSGGTK